MASPTDEGSDGEESDHEVREEIQNLRSRVREVEHSLESLERQVKTEPPRTALQSCDMCGNVFVRYGPVGEVACPSCGNSGLHRL